MAWTLEDLEESLLIGSTLVEGSTLSEAEARQVLRGRTLAGHSVQEHRELLNYRAAVAWLMEQLARSPYLSVDLVLAFHRRLLDGLSDTAGQTKRYRNYTYLSDGSRYDYLPPAEVEPALREWVARFDEEPAADPWARAAELYYELQRIHPFDDGNGRVGRVLIAYWVHWKLGCSWKFVAADKVAHLEALEAATAGDMSPLRSFIRERAEPEDEP